jgi:prepilin-type processing-associated H-X9-DG protein
LHEQHETIALAFHNYHDTRGSFPAAAQFAPDGNQLQSWRLWVIAFVEQSSFFDRYDLDEAWDGPNNTKLTSIGYGSLFQCPTSNSVAPSTDYFAVVGEQTMWPPGRGRKISEVSDGTSNTILFIEAPHKRIPWAKPEDLSFDEAVELLTNPPKGEHFGHELDEGFFYKRSKGINVAFVDGSVQLLRLPLAKEDAVALLTVDGGEISDRQTRRLKNPELDYARIYSLTLFLLLSLLPLAKLIKRNRKIAAI